MSLSLASISVKSSILTSLRSFRICGRRVSCSWMNCDSMPIRRRMIRFASSIGLVRWLIVSSSALSLVDLHPWDSLRRVWPCGLWIRLQQLPWHNRMFLLFWLYHSEQQKWWFGDIGCVLSCRSWGCSFDCLLVSSNGLVSSADAVLADDWASHPGLFSTKYTKPHWHSASSLTCNSHSSWEVKRSHSTHWWSWEKRGSILRPQEMQISWLSWWCRSPWRNRGVRSISPIQISTKGVRSIVTTWIFQRCRGLPLSVWGLVVFAEILLHD